MGHYDNCRPGYCGSCGAAPENIRADGSCEICDPRLKTKGFASMDPQRRREIASEGGRAAHEKGTAYEWTSEEARAAGRKGGLTRAANRAAELAKSLKK
jgi:general stress protein YciG